MHKAITNIALECLLITLLRYSNVLVTKPFLWFLARQPNLTTNVEQYMLLSCDI